MTLHVVLLLVVYEIGAANVLLLFRAKMDFVSDSYIARIIWLALIVLLWPLVLLFFYVAHLMGFLK